MLGLHFCVSVFLQFRRAFSRQGTWAVGSAGFKSWGNWAQYLWRRGLVALSHVGSSQTKDWTSVPCLADREPLPPDHQGSPDHQLSCDNEMCSFGFEKLILKKNVPDDNSVCEAAGSVITHPCDTYHPYRSNDSPQLVLLIFNSKFSWACNQSELVIINRLLLQATR